MKVISTFAQLGRFGIVPLTGEACALNYRVLCDVTAKGKHIIGKCLGIPNMTFAEPWNRGTDADPHVGSIMLAHELLIPLAVFACLESGCTEAYRMDEFVVGVEPDDPPTQATEVELIHRVKRVRRFRYGAPGSVGDRNVHQMTGRVV